MALAQTDWSAIGWKRRSIVPLSERATRSMSSTRRCRPAAAAADHGEGGVVSLDGVGGRRRHGPRSTPGSLAARPERCRIRRGSRSAAVRSSWLTSAKKRRRLRSISESFSLAARRSEVRAAIVVSSARRSRRTRSSPRRSRAVVRLKTTASSPSSSRRRTGRCRLRSPWPMAIAASRISATAASIGRETSRHNASDRPSATMTRAAADRCQHREHAACSFAARLDHRGGRPAPGRRGTAR